MSGEIRIHRQGSRVPFSGETIIVEGNGWVCAKTLDPPYTQADIDRLTEELVQRNRELAKG